MLIPEHQIVIPDNIYEYVPYTEKDENRMPIIIDFEHKRRILNEMVISNNIPSKPIIVIDPNRVGIDHPAAVISISESQSIEELIAMFCVYISLDRRKEISEQVARQVVSRCLNTIKLRHLSFTRSQRAKIKPVHQKVRTIQAPWLTSSAPVQKESENQMQSNSRAISLPQFMNHWLIHFRELPWMEFLRKAYYIMENPFLYVAEKTILRSAIVIRCKEFFDRMMLLSNVNLLQWDLTMDLAYDAFSILEDD